MIRRAISFLILPICAAAMLEAQLKDPHIGVVRYPDGTVHSVSGLPANYVVNPATFGSADAASFSDTAGLIAKNGHILLINGAFESVAQYDTNETAPLLNVDGDVNSAVAWLPSRPAILRWNGASFVMAEVNGAGALGKVSSIRLADANTVKLLATTSDGRVSEATISLPEAELTSLEVLPGVQGPAFRQHSFVVFYDRRGIEIASSTAIVRTLSIGAAVLNKDLTGDLTFERMSSDSLHVISSSTGQSWVLHLGSSAPALLFQLPEPPTRVAHTLPLAPVEAAK